MRLTPSDHVKARELLEKAIALDPNYASAFTLLAWAYLHEFRFFRSESPKEVHQKALDVASRAVALDPSLGDVRAALSYALLYGRKHDEALVQYEEGLKANPNEANLLAWSAEVFIWTGQAEEAIQRIKEAIRLNPYHPNWYWWVLAAARYCAACDYEGAIETLRQMSPIGEAKNVSCRLPCPAVADGGGADRGRKVHEEKPDLLGLRLGQQNAVSP